MVMVKNEIEENLDFKAFALSDLAAICTYFTRGLIDTNLCDF